MTDNERTVSDVHSNINLTLTLSVQTSRNFKCFSLNLFQFFTDSNQQFFSWIVPLQINVMMLKLNIMNIEGVTLRNIFSLKTTLWISMKI